MSPDEKRAYLLNTIHRSTDGSARRIWATSMLAQLDHPTQAPQPDPKREKPVRVAR